MDFDIFDINKFNVIQDEENYYFFRALNMADNADIEQQTTTSTDGKIERIRTDRERFDGDAKYTEASEISLEEIYDHIKMHYRKDTNCISLTSNANIAVNYGRGSYKDKYVMVKIPKKEFGEKTLAAGQYMLKELYSKIQQAIESLPEDAKQRVSNAFEEIDKATESKDLKDIIAQRYTANREEVSLDRAHLRKGIIYSSPKARISNYQSLDDEQVLEVNKVYAKLAILENEQVLKHVIPHSSNSKLRETIGSAFSSTEVIHYGDIKQENIIEVPKEVVDLFALIQQIDGLDKGRVEQLKRTLITAVQNGVKIPAIPEIEEKVKADISIEEMYGITDGKVEYGKANSIVKNMFYLSKARKNAIQLSNVLSEILGQNSGFEDIIQYIRENGFRVEPEIITRQSNKGVKLSESVSLDLQQEEQILVNEIKKLSFEELDIVDITEFKFQFDSRLSLPIKNKLREFITTNYNLTVSNDDFLVTSHLNSIYDTAYMLPYIIHNTIFKKNSLTFLKAFDVLEKEINNALVKVRLEKYKYFYPCELSGGMRQRINFARALIGNPEVILMDEPFKSLDIKSKNNMIELIKNLKNTDITIILVTHDINEILMLADVVYYLGGRPVEIIESAIGINIKNIIKKINKPIDDLE